MPPLTVGKLNSPLVELYDKFDSPDARLIALLAKVFEKYLLVFEFLKVINMNEEELKAYIDTWHWKSN